MQRFALVLLLLLGGCLAAFAQNSKPSPITKEALEQRLAALKRDRTQAVANVNAYDGAIQECQFWLELLKDAEEEEEMIVEFPKMMYHKDKEPVVVNNPKEEKALGPGWFHNPGLKREKPAAPVVEPEAEGVAPPAVEEEAEEPVEKPKDKKKPK